MSELFSRFRMTDIAAWPEALQAYAWRIPWRSLPIVKDPDTGFLILTGTAPETAPQDVLPKLTIKSWQESGRLRLIPAGLPLAPAIQARLATPTYQQLQVLQAWDDADTPPLLHLFPFTDMGNVSEARFLCTGSTLRRLSLCSRNHLAPTGSDIAHIAEAVAAAMPGLGPFILQIAAGPDGVPRILDINPGLTPTDLAELTSEDTAA